MLLTTAGYGIAAAAYTALFAFLLFGRRVTWPFNYLLLFAATMTLWALAMLGVASGEMRFGQLIVVEALHAAGPLVFLGQLIGAGSDGGWRRAFAIAPWLIVPGAALVYWWASTSGSVSFESVYYFVVFLSLAGLLAAEQVYRNPGLIARSAAVPVAVSLGTLFVFDLYTYSNALLTSNISEPLWAARGFVNALAVPILVLAIKREPDWKSRLFVSRHVVFYTASLVGVGAYLLLVAFGSILIQRLGGDWSAVLRIVFLVFSLAMLALVLFSEQIRRRAKVFLATHFYANRYDYREEWLRLISRLAQDSDRAPMPELCLDALADIIGSDGGVLWLPEQGDVDGFYVAAAFGEGAAASDLPADHPLLTFLHDKAWVIDGAEALSDPAHYDHAFDAGRDDVVTPDRIVVPLVLDGALSGVAALNRPSGMPAMNFEDHDLLRTVGQQLSVFLQFSRSREALVEAREFNVLNRFTAFIMHDMKNLVAQLSLVVANAERHKSNPEFVDDAIGTIANAVYRMNGLIAQLQSGTETTKPVRFAIAGAIGEAIDGTHPRQPVPELDVADDATIRADRERFVTVLEHLIRNAQDACGQTGGGVQISVSADGGKARIRIADEGVGMNDTFIRERLFKPFDSTKGAQGMGIGAYQAREFVRALGGTLTVESRPERGTMVTIELPCA